MILLIVVTVGLILTVIFMPKRISVMEMYTSSYFASYIAAIADLYLDVKLDYYGFFNKGVDWRYLPVIILVYPTTNIIFLNFFPFKKGKLGKVMYILIWSVMATAMEFVAAQTELFYHNEWKLWYSALCYPFLFGILYLNLKTTRRLSKMEKANK